MHAEYQGHLFPKQPKALVFPDLFDKRVTVANHALARQPLEAGCGSVSPMIGGFFSQRGKLIDNWCWIRVKRVIVI